MKQLAIVLPNGTSTLGSLILAVEVFEKANEYFESREKEPVFKVELVGDSRSGKITLDAFSVLQHRHIKQVDNPHLIIVPALGDDIEMALKKNKGIINWIIDRYKGGSEVASLCTGAFVLAAAGLLNGKQCSTHWSAANEFKIMFPGTDLEIDKIITEEHGIYTTGGAISSMNLVLHIVEKFYDRDTAVYCSKIFGVDIDRSNQSAFIIFSGQKNHDDKEIKKAQLFMEKNWGERIAIENLSAKFSIERRNFDRRFKKATGNTPHEYMQRIRIEAAKKYLESSRKTINEVMYDVGYSDVKTFREVFRKIAGMSPLEYKGKYNREA